MVEGAVIENVARERDQALGRLQVLAAEIRAHEQTVGRSIMSCRPADERFTPRLRQGGSDDEDKKGRQRGAGRPCVDRGLQRTAHQGPRSNQTGPNQKGRGPWDW
jgi:hypothetical protein